MQDVIITD